MGLKELFTEAAELVGGNNKGAASLYNRIIFEERTTGMTEEEIKIKENSIQALAKIYANEKKADRLASLVKQIRPFFSVISNSKAAKITRVTFDVLQAYAIEEPSALPVAIECVEDIINWTRENSRTFLRHKMQTRLGELLWRSEKFQEALDLLKVLLLEVKKLDDKQQLVQIQLIESKVHHSLENVPKSKASLTSVKTTSTSIYITPMMQAEVDMMSGILCAEERDYNTAFSYFYEAYETYRVGGHRYTTRALKYMLLAKTMDNKTDDVFALLNSGIDNKYMTPDIEAMRRVASANKNRSLVEFEKCLEEYDEQLVRDKIIKHHIKDLYSLLFESNLKKLVEPYSEVQLDYISKQIGLPSLQVQQKLSEMILDKKIKGTLDQGRDCLILFEEQEEDKSLSYAIKTFENLDGVVTALYKKLKLLKKE